jgi:hypothetical protein
MFGSILVLVDMHGDFAVIVLSAHNEEAVLKLRRRRHGGFELNKHLACINSRWLYF